VVVGCSVWFVWVRVLWVALGSGGGLKKIGFWELGIGIFFYFGCF